jgi:hypothetical protein
LLTCPAEIEPIGRPQVCSPSRESIVPVADVRVISVGRVEGERPAWVDATNGAASDDGLESCRWHIHADFSGATVVGARCSCPQTELVGGVTFQRVGGQREFELVVARCEGIKYGGKALLQKSPLHLHSLSLLRDGHVAMAVKDNPTVHLKRSESVYLS